MQRRVTKTLPMSEELFTDHIAAAERHVRLATEYLGHRPATWYEFGAGWDLVVPLVLARDGLRDQTLTDVRGLVRQELVADSAARLGVDPPAALGINYIAPVDAMATGLPSGSFKDLVTSTDTLEHVPRTATRPVAVGVPTTAATGWGPHCPDRLSGSLRIQRPVYRPVPFPSVQRTRLAPLESAGALPVTPPTRPITFEQSRVRGSRSWQTASGTPDRRARPRPSRIWSV